MTSRDHSIVSSSQCILLTFLVLSLALHAGAETRLYFDRTVSEFVRIGEEAGEILSYETIGPVSEAVRFQMGDRQPAEVRALGRGMTLVIRDVRGRGEVARGWAMEDHDKDWAWARVYRRSRSSNGYDAPYVSSDFDFPERGEVEVLFAEPGKAPTGISVIDALIAVPSEDAMRAAMLAVSDPQAAFPLIEQCRAPGLENDLFLVAVEIEAAAISNDAGRIQKLLSAHGTRLLSSGNAVYVGFPDFYERWLRGHAEDERGRNFHWTISDLRAFAEDEDREGIRRILKRVPDDGVAFNHRATLLLNWRDVRTFPILSTNGLRHQLSAAVLSDLVRGDFDSARTTVTGLTRTASVMSHRTPDLFSSLLATALRGISAWMWRWLLLDSTLPSGELALAARDLEALAALDKEGLLHPTPIEEFVPGGDRLHPPSLIEFHTRNRVAHTQLALLHAVAVACIQRQNDGKFPASPWQFYDLLGDLAGDPWADWEEPLLYLPMADRAVIYSRGPNGRDDSAAVQYDPTNGSLSGGDLIEEVLLHPPRGFPLPLGDRFSPHVFQQHLPSGIRRNRSIAWNVGHVNSVPASVFCDGPMAWGPFSGRKLVGDLPNDHAAIEYNDSWYDLGPASALAEYDPTNGTFSEGVIYLVRDGQPVR